MDVPRYLERLRYDGSLEPSVATLRALHRAHMSTIPFESIDVYLGRPIDLATDALFEKLVVAKRGGFCYELNGLFAELLRALRFDVTLLNAEVAREEGGFGPPFDHLALLVRVDGRWLADVGFGRSSLEPLRIDTEESQLCAGGEYRIRADGERRVVSARNGDAWNALYRFDLTPRRTGEFLAMCGFHATSPDSPFHAWLGCTLSTPDGRLTLSDDKLIERRGDERFETTIAPEDIAPLLASRFGITVDHDWSGKVGAAVRSTEA